MPGLDYTGKESVRGKQIAEIAVEQLYVDPSIANGIIELNTGSKHGVTKTETSTAVTEQLYTGQALTADGSFVLFDYQILHVKGEFKIDILQDTLRDTPFADDMAAGAANIDSSRFMQLAADQLGKRVAHTTKTQRWGGITTATKAAIAALTPGAGQGSISAATQAIVAALDVTLRDGWFAVMIYNAFRATKVAGLGEYLKVAGTTVTSSNIAAEYAKIYLGIPVVERDSTEFPFILNAPLSHKAFMKIANNAVGATTNKNFLDEGGKLSYNGIEVNFVELPEDIVMGAPKKTLALNMDLESDDNAMEVGEYANGSDVKFFRNINAWSVHISRQATNVLYGG
jgi:hypothetical protein